MLRWLWLSVIVVVLDQLSKQWVEAHFYLYESLPINGFLNLTLVYNKGAAFSFLADAGGWQRWFFVVLAVAISLYLISWLHKLQSSQIVLPLAISMIIGGAIGNVIDRFIYGHVIDFVDIYVQQWHWPAFNVADSAITLGVILFLWESFFGQNDDLNRL